MDKNQKNWKEKWTKMDSIRYLIQNSKRVRKGLGAVAVAADALRSSAKFNASFHDYFNLRFYDLTDEEREKFLTGRMVLAEKKKWGRAIDKVDNKQLFNEIFSDYLGREWIDAATCDYETFFDFINRHPVFYAKRKRESLGIGIRKCHLEEIEDTKALFEELKEQDMIVEEELIVSDVLQQLNPNSVSQVRVVTVYNGDVDILAAALRTGVKMPYNLAGDDLICQVDPQTGVVFTGGSCEDGNTYEYHPVSGIRLIGFKIPEWDKIIAACKDAARRVPDVKVIGWDVVLTDKGICFFEGNPGSGVASMQLADRVGKKELFYSLLNKNSETEK